LALAWAAAGCAHKPVEDPVVVEVAGRTRIAQPEVRELLADCQKTQLALNTCALRDLVVAEDRMNGQVSRKYSFLGCRQDVAQRQDAWAKQRDASCKQSADGQSQGGSLWPMLYTSCQAIETEMRTAAIERMRGCQDLKWP
jgi:uncharacterized protein YecT (DUF1311 family)